MWNVPFSRHDRKISIFWRVPYKTIKRETFSWNTFIILYGLCTVYQVRALRREWWGEFLCLFSSYFQYLMRDWIIHAWSEIEHAVYSRVSHRQESQFQKIVRRNIYRYLRSFVRSSACSCKRSESNTANVNKLKCLSFTHQVALGQRCRFGFLQQIVGNGQAFPRQRGVIFLKIKNKNSHPS